jgi:hypothetical protein
VQRESCRLTSRLILTFLILVPFSRLSFLLSDLISPVPCHLVPHLPSLISHLISTHLISSPILQARGQAKALSTLRTSLVRYKHWRLERRRQEALGLCIATAQAKVAHRHGKRTLSEVASPSAEPEPQL